MVNSGYAQLSGGQWWICSCEVVANGGYSNVQLLSMMDMFMCNGDQ